MEANLNLGDWIKAKFGKKAKFAEKIGADPTLVSRWLGGKGISEDYQAKIRKLGFTGLWPVAEAQDAAAGGPAPYLTREEFAEWRGYWKAGTEELLKRLEALEDQVRTMRPPGTKA